MKMNALPLRSIASTARRYPLGFIAAALFSLAAAWAGMDQLAHATTWGPGVGGDATIYLTTARNFLRGAGLGWVTASGSYRLLPYFPPFYPLVLSFVGLFTPDLVAGARWLNILLAGGTTLVTGLIFWRQTHRPLLAGMLAGLVALSHILLSVNVWAMSEGLFLFLEIAGLALLLVYFDTRRTLPLYASGVLLGLAFLARYAGAGLVGAAGAALLLHWGLERRTEKFPIKPYLAFLLLAVLPTALWLVIDYALTGTVSSRSGQPVSAYWARFVEMGPRLHEIYLQWLLTDDRIARLTPLMRSVLLFAPLAGVAACAGLFGWKIRRQGSAEKLLPGIRLALLMALVIVFYLLVLAFAQVFTYPPVTLASRMLSPVHLAALVFAAAVVALGLSIFEPVGRMPRLLTVLAYLAVFAGLLWYARLGSAFARGYHNAGSGYTSRDWQTSEVMKVVRQLPPEVPLISNDDTALLFLLQRPAYPLQEIYAQTPLNVYTSYGEGTDDAQQVFREEGGALVLFNASLKDDFGKYGDRVDERLAALTRGLYLYYQGEDGSIYFSSPSVIRRDP